VSINLLILGIATTISPLFVIAAVLMMSESEKVRTSWAAAFGWAVSIGVCCAAMVVLGGVVHDSGSAHRKHWWFGAIDLAIGLVVAYFALREFRRSRSNADRDLPRWMNRVGTMSVITAFGLGLFLPANVLAYAAGSEIVQQHFHGAEKWVAVALYVAIGSMLELLPVLYLTVRPMSRERLLSTWHRWLDNHWEQVLVVLFGVVSVFLIVKGVVAILRA
jgi:threonine/homoserine/homoserine lactone efflux protein